jgi:ABC-2 type transport system permease protein
VIAAILRAQWLSMRFGGGARALTIIAALFWYGLWAVGATGAGFAIAEAAPAWLRIYLPLGAGGVFLYWQLMPVLSASMGSALDLRKLLPYPIPHGKLFTVEVLLRLTTAVEMLILIAGGVAGLIANPAVGGWRAAARIALTLPVFVVFNLLLASGTRSLFERLLARRRIREVVVLLTTMLWVLPRLFLSMGYRGQLFARLGAAMQTVLLPWTAMAHAAIGQSAAPAAISLCGWTALAGWFGRWQFERNLRYDAAAAQAAREPVASSRVPITERFFRMPAIFLPDPVAGIVEKELRSLARTPRFRTVFIMGFTFGLAVWFPTIAVRGAGEVRQGSPWFLTVVCAYALMLLGQVSYWNCFGFDRGAAALYFAAPLSLGQVLAAKNIAALVYIYLEVILVVVVTSVLRLTAGLAPAVETLVVMGVCALYMLAMGNLSSVHYPRGLSGERVSQGGGRGFQGFLFLLYPIALLPVGLAYLARYAFDSEIMFGLILAIAAIIGGVFYWIAMESAVNAAGRLREKIVQELSQSDGPVVGE